MLTLAAPQIAVATTAGDVADTAWLLAASAMVLVMVPRSGRSGST